MRRWTVLIIPHDTEAPRSFLVTERTLRRTASLGAAVMLVGLIVAGTFVARLGSLPLAPASARAVPEPANSAEVLVLQARLGAIRGALDTIRREDARLRAVAGVPATDSTTLLRRFVTRLPRFLRESRTGAPPTAPRPPMAQVAGATVEADSLLMHATGLADRYRQLGSDRLHLDTLEVLSLRPESLHVAASEANARVTRAGRTVQWNPNRRGALLAGFDAEVAHAIQHEAGRWQIDLRAPGGLVGRVSAAGRPAVRKGERVLADQPVMLVSPAGSTGHASYELRRNGISLDPTYTRSSFSMGTTRP